MYRLHVSSRSCYRRERRRRPGEEKEKKTMSEIEHFQRKRTYHQESYSSLICMIKLRFSERSLRTYPIKLDFRTLYSRAFELKSELTEMSVSESTRRIAVCCSTFCWFWFRSWGAMILNGFSDMRRTEFFRKRFSSDARYASE